MKEYKPEGLSALIHAAGTPGRCSGIPTRKPTIHAIQPAQLIPSRGPDHLLPEVM